MGRLREGKGVTLKTMHRIRQYINVNSPFEKLGQEVLEENQPGNLDQNPTVLDVSSNDELLAYEQPFRFYDNRQKYLSFVYTCNEKPSIAKRILRELQHIQVEPPGLRVFDAGIGDGLVLCEILRGIHDIHPKVPIYVNGKEISDENVRLCLEKMPDRFCEHPELVLVISNMRYREAPALAPGDIREASAMNWIEVPLQGDTSHSFAQQIGGLQKTLREGWQTRRSSRTGTPVPIRPSVIILYREDHRLLLNHMLPRPNNIINRYDLVIASHPWQARVSAEKKVSLILLPLVKSLDTGGRMVAIQAAGNDPGHEILLQEWPNEQPFSIDRSALLKQLKSELGREAGLYNLNTSSDKKALLKYSMHTLPSEINENLGTSTLMAAWNAAIYVGQVEDEKLEAAIAKGTYLESTRKVLKKHDGLWFQDECFVISRRRL
jgi:hypothetical protein